MSDLKNLPPKYCFIDAQNFDSFFRLQGDITGLNSFIDYEKLYYYLIKQIKVKTDKVFLFLKETYHQPKLKLLEKFGFNIVLCKAKAEQSNGRLSHNIDIDLVIRSLIEYYEIEDHDLVLLTGDGDFVPLLDFYEERGAAVQLICPSRSKILGGFSPTSSKLITKNYKTGEQRQVLYLDEIDNHNLFR